MNAIDVMTRSVVTVPPTASIADAIHLMLDQCISGLPVVNDRGQIVGILTERDLLRRAELGTEKAWPAWVQFVRGAGRQAQDYVSAHGRAVEDLMTRTVAVVAETTPLEDVVELMEKRGIKRVPVVKDERLVGIISRADLLRALAQLLVNVLPPVSTDAEARERISAELNRQPWGGRTHVSVIVTNGVAYLEGIVYDDRERNAVRVAAENVVGINSVRDHLEYYNPYLGRMYGYGL